jgi:hypothetical protein
VKYILKTILPLSLLIMVLSGCQELMDEDQKITNILIGKFYEDDEELEDGSLIKDISMNYYEDGSFISKATMLVEGEGDFDQTEVLFYFEGKWEVKNQFIFYSWDFDRFRITPSNNSYMLETVKESLQKKNSPDEIISYDEASVVYKTVEGKLHTMKKTI